MNDDNEEYLFYVEKSFPLLDEIIKSPNSDSDKATIITGICFSYMDFLLNNFVGMTMDKLMEDFKNAYESKDIIKEVQ